MADITKRDVIEFLNNSSPAEICEVFANVHWLGVSVNLPICQGCGAGVSGPHACPGRKEENRNYNIVMTDCGPNKIQVIKVIRELTGLGLKEAKDLAERKPHSTVRFELAKRQADEEMKIFKEAGATAHLEPL